MTNFFYGELIEIFNLLVFSPQIWFFLSLFEEANYYIQQKNNEGPSVVGWIGTTSDHAAQGRAPRP